MLRIVFQPLQAYWEQSKGWGGKGFWLRKGWITSPNMKVSPTIKLWLTEVVGCFYWLMLFKPLATGVNALSLLMMEACLPPHLSEQLMHWLCRIQRLWRRSVLAPERGEFSILLLVSSSTFCNSRLHNGKGSCADRPRNRTGNRRSAGIKNTLRQLLKMNF